MTQASTLEGQAEGLSSARLVQDGLRSEQVKTQVAASQTLDPSMGGADLPRRAR